MDFDDAKSYDQCLIDYPELSRAYTIKTRKGYHIYFIYDPEIIQGTDCFSSYPHTDVRNDGGNVLSPPTSYKYIDGSIAMYEHHIRKSL